MTPCMCHLPHLSLAWCFSLRFFLRWVLINWLFDLSRLSRRQGNKFCRMWKISYQLKDVKHREFFFNAFAEKSLGRLIVCAAIKEFFCKCFWYEKFWMFDPLRGNIRFLLSWELKLGCQIWRFIDFYCVRGRKFYREATYLDADVFVNVSFIGPLKDVLIYVLSSYWVSEWRHFSISIR